MHPQHVYGPVTGTGRLSSYIDIWWVLDRVIRNLYHVKASMVQVSCMTIIQLLYIMRFNGVYREFASDTCSTNGRENQKTSTHCRQPYKGPHSKYPSCICYAEKWRRSLVADTAAMGLQPRRTPSSPHATWQRRQRSLPLQACATLPQSSAAVIASMRGIWASDVLKRLT